MFSVFEEEDQSAYFTVCLFVLFVSAGKRMYLQHYALRSFCFPLEIHEVVFFVLPFFFFFALSLLICKRLFLTLVGMARHVLLFLRNKEV